VYVSIVLQAAIEEEEADGCKGREAQVSCVDIPLPLFLIFIILENNRFYS